jgi:hypothetical protein
MFALKNAYFNKLIREFYLNIKLNKHFSNGSKFLIRNYNLGETKKFSILNKNILEKNCYLTNNLKQNIKQEQIKYYTSFTDKTTSSVTHTTTSATPDLLIDRNFDGIVELKLNRTQGKNSLSKKLLSEVINSIIN